MVSRIILWIEGFAQTKGFLLRSDLLLCKNHGTALNSFLNVEQNVDIETECEPLLSRSIFSYICLTCRKGLIDWKLEVSPKI